MKFGLLVSICAVGSLAQPWNANGFVYDGQGNMGVGRGNDYSGVGNRWVGNDNLMYGNANSVAGNWNQVSGRDNAISGGTNSITGKKNAVKGENNQVYGENNVVQGTGNIVSSGGSTDFDFEANLPKWMRSSSNTGSPQASTLVPSNPNPSNYNPYPRQSPYSNDDRQSFCRFGHPKGRPCIRQVLQSPGRTEIREVYITPDSQQDQSSQRYSNSNGYNNRNWRNTRDPNSMDLNSRIRNQVQQKLDAAFSKVFL